MDFSNTLARAILGNHAKLGLEAPKPIADALDGIERVQAGIAKLDASPNTIAAAVSDALLAGRDPATDKTVTRLLTIRQLKSNDTMAIEQDARNRFIERFRTYSGDLIDQWADAFDSAADTIREEVPHLGNVDLNRDAEQVLNRGGDIATHFLAARDANNTIELIRECLSTLGTATSMFRIDKHRTGNLVITPATLEQWETHELYYRSYTAWELANLGLTLSFATPTEYTERIAALQRTREQRMSVARDNATGRNPNLAKALGL